MGRGNLNHYGNLKFRQVIDEYQLEYEQADKNGKTNVAMKIVQIIKNNGGRFLKKDKNLGWVQESDEAARYRVSHRFRNMRGPGGGGGGSGSGGGGGNSRAGDGSTTASSGSGSTSKRKNRGVTDSPSLLSTSSTIVSENISATGSRPPSVPPIMSNSASADSLASPVTAASTTIRGSGSGGGGGSSILGIQVPSFSLPHPNGQHNNSKRPRGQQITQQSEGGWMDNGSDGCFFLKQNQPFASCFGKNGQNMIG